MYDRPAFIFLLAMKARLVHLLSLPQLLILRWLSSPTATAAQTEPIYHH
jgi:hypothetical protein